MLWGLLLGNLIDLDHIYSRIVGDVGWFESACVEFGKNCSFGFYPLHNWTFGIMFLVLGGLIFFKDKRLKFVGWLCLGAFFNLVLDYIHMIIGFGV
ncbi:hypothetical protein KAJ87_04010 [Candidatus Pacearchaeota archaeon]|nr:hypothetical protein [Candidatus Pacearchaeota archaeon]